MINKESSMENDISNGLPHSYEKVILIDCMDTILYRDITLDYLLALWAKKMGKVFNVYPKFLFHYRREVVKSKMHNTVPIEIIYGEIYDHCQYFGLINTCSKKEFVTKAHEIELNIELDHHHLISDTVTFLKKAKDKGAQIYCVSDLRLSSSDIHLFFSHLGIENLFSSIFSSCDIGKTKKSGDFYNYVLEHIQKQPSDCLMIGDNYKSDCINACKNGIKSFMLQKTKASKICTLTSKIKSAFICLR